MNAFMNTTTNTSANTSTQTCNSLSGCHKLPHCVEFMTAGTQKRKALTDKRRQADEALPLCHLSVLPATSACNIFQHCHATYTKCRSSSSSSSRRSKLAAAATRFCVPHVAATLSCWCCCSLSLYLSVATCSQLLCAASVGSVFFVAASTPAAATTAAGDDGQHEQHAAANVATLSCGKCCCD